MEDGGHPFVVSEVVWNLIIPYAAIFERIVEPLVQGGPFVMVLLTSNWDIPLINALGQQGSYSSSQLAVRT